MLDRIRKALKKPYSTIIAPLFFPGTKNYWEKRYATGDNSGLGSYGDMAQFKADVINDFVAEQSIQSVIELGCGDGNQLKLAKYPSYIGFDISPTAIALCRKLFPNDPAIRFALLDDYNGEKADLTLSLDVVYHLVEDEVFEDHMKMLFDAAKRFVIIYSINSDTFEEKASHIRVRKFSNWIDQNRTDWTLLKFIPNKYPYNIKDGTGSFADFYIYKKNETA